MMNGKSKQLITVLLCAKMHCRFIRFKFKNEKMQRTIYCYKSNSMKELHATKKIRNIFSLLFVPPTAANGD